jgi:hypothetical protein
MSEMNESEIVEKTTPKEEKIEYGEPEPSISKVKEYESLRSLFNVENRSSRSEDYLQKIWNYAKENASNKDRESIIFEAIRLKNRLGSPSIGESVFTRIINYITVYNRHKQDELLLGEMNGQEGKS